MKSTPTIDELAGASAFNRAAGPSRTVGGEVEVVGLDWIPGPNGVLPQEHKDLYDPFHELPPYKPISLERAYKGLPKYIGACSAVYGNVVNVESEKISSRTQLKSTSVNWEDFYGELPNGAGYC